MPSVEEAEAHLRRSVQTYETLKDNNAAPAVIRTAECAIFGAEETVTLARAQANGSLADMIECYRHAEVQGLRIGDAILIGWPGEIFVEYALELKKAAARKAFVVSLVNGDSQGYIVTEEAAAGGGYEAMNSLFEAAAGECLVNAGVALCRRLAALEE